MFEKREPGLELRLFDEGAGASGAAACEGGADGTAPAGAQEKGGAKKAGDGGTRKTEFERLIKEEYKDLYDERVKKLLERRFRSAKAGEAKLAEQEKLISALKSAYGTDDTAEILKKLSQTEKRKGPADMSANIPVIDRWLREEQETRQIYPAFRMMKEALDPQTGDFFMNMLAAGVDARSAYEVVHRDDLIGGVMQYTAEKVREKTINDIRARGLRPEENGAGGSAGARMVKADPAAWSDEEIDRVIERVKRGERIVL